MIKVEDLSKKFSLNKEQRKERNTKDHFAFAVKDISFECKPGEIFSLLGPNGAGKTTLILHLNGILGNLDEKIKIDNFLYNEQNISRIRKTVGLVFQDPDDQLFMPTVLEDITFGLGSVERLEVVSRDDALAQLLESFRAHRRTKLALSQDKRLQQRSTIDLKIGEHPQLFDGFLRQPLRFINHQQNALTLLRASTKEGFQILEQTRFRDPVTFQPECGGDETKQIVGLQVCRYHLRRHYILFLKGLKERSD